MQIPKNDGYGAATAATTAAVTGQNQKSGEAEKSGEELSLVERIRTQGFGAYVKQMQAEKLEKMRAEILAKMGLDEEKLEEMPADQRATIENVIEEEMRRRMMANAAVEQAEESNETVAGTAARSGRVSELVPLDVGQKASSGMGFDVLQAIENLDRDSLDISAEKKRQKG